MSCVVPVLFRSYDHEVLSIEIGLTLLSFTKNAVELHVFITGENILCAAVICFEVCKPSEHLWSTGRCCFFPCVICVTPALCS